jgi:hypothetical protein
MPVKVLAPANQVSVDGLPVSQNLTPCASKLFAIEAAWSVCGPGLEIAEPLAHQQGSTVSWRRGVGFEGRHRAVLSIKPLWSGSEAAIHYHGDSASISAARMG